LAKYIYYLLNSCSIIVVYHFQTPSYPSLASNLAYFNLRVSHNLLAAYRKRIKKLTREITKRNLNIAYTNKHFNGYLHHPKIFEA